MSNRIEVAENGLYLSFEVTDCGDVLFLHFGAKPLESAVLCLSQTLNLSDHRPLTLPLGMILYAVATIIIPNRGFAISFDTTIRPFYALTFGLLLPLLLLGIAVVRKKR